MTIAYGQRYILHDDVAIEMLDKRRRCTAWYRDVDRVAFMNQRECVTHDATFGIEYQSVHGVAVCTFERRFDFGRDLSRPPRHSIVAADDHQNKIAVVDQ